MYMQSFNKKIVPSLVSIILLALLVFLLIPFSYGISLPFVYWINQSLFFILLLLFSYLNTKWLAQKFLFQKKYIKYYSILFIGCLLMIFILRKTGVLLNLSEEIKKAANENIQYQNHRRGSFSVIFYTFLIQVLVLGVNISGILIRKWQVEKNMRLQLEKDKVEMELSFLKSQINPHFFFNSLNTINALTYLDIDQSRNALKKLGKIMRYVLYSTDNQSSTLSKELELIENYLDLMKMRSPKNVIIDFTVNTTLTDLTIAPMLFLPFIENSFKHGVSTQTKSPIIITVEEKNNIIKFYIKNNIFDRNVGCKISEDNFQGIGVQNTKRRLELLYNSKYSLSVNKENSFEVELIINLNDD